MIVLSLNQSSAQTFKEAAIASQWRLKMCEMQREASRTVECFFVFFLVEGEAGRTGHHLIVHSVLST